MIQIEVILAAGYAVLLALVGLGFGWMAARNEREAVDRTAAESGSDPSLAHLEAARFHRGLALVVCVCAAYILLFVALRHATWPSLALLAAAACAPTWAAVRTYSGDRPLNPRTHHPERKSGDWVSVRNGIRGTDTRSSSFGAFTRFGPEIGVSPPNSGPPLQPSASPPAPQPGPQSNQASRAKPEDAADKR